jgi:DNA-binding NarL/FixJ family response regulator
MIKKQKRIAVICENDKMRELYSTIIESLFAGNALLIGAFLSTKSATVALAKIDIDLLIFEHKQFSHVESDFLFQIRERNPSIEILLVLESIKVEQLPNVLSSGICGIVLKESGLTTIIQAIQDVSTAGAYLSPALVRMLVESFWLNQFSPLTNRETEVLKLITEGKTYSEIARQLSVSLETSKTHIRNIYKKLDVNSKSEVVMRAINDRLVLV